MTKQMECNNECRFCKIAQGIYDLGKIDMPFIEDDEYMALLSVGGFIEGWTLIIPKKHILSMKEIYKKPKFQRFLDQTIEYLSKIYGKDFIVFEHGADHEGSIVACGTNHAHLHIVPYEKSLIEAMSADGLEWHTCSFDNIENTVGDGEYWFYAENVTVAEKVDGVAHRIKNKESQYFRKLLAYQEGCKDFFDYKKYSHLDVVNKACDKIGK